MRKLVYLIVVVLLAQVLVAQTTTPMKPYATLKSALEKMEQSVQEPNKDDYPDEKKFTKAKAKHAKKVNNPSTWFNLAEAYKEIFMYAGADISIGAPMQTTMYIKGTAKEKATLENKETWTYEAFKIYFEDGNVKKWELNEKYPEAAKKAVAAYKEAYARDEKGSIKKKVVESLVELRNFLRNEGIMYYFDEKLEDAIANYKCSSHIYSMSEMEGADTTKYNISELFYYGAAFAEANKDVETAIFFYKKNIEYCKNAPVNMQYEFVKTYRYLTNDYKIVEKMDLYEATLMQSYEQFPENKDILVDLTQFYLDGGNSQLALEFLNKALDKDPKNFLYIFVKGTLFDGFKIKVYDKMDLIRAEVYNADTARQEGKMSRKDFGKFRDNKIIEANELWLEADKEMSKSVAEYNRALEIEPDYFNAKFNLGALLYNKGAQIIKLADLIPTSDMKTYDSEMKKAKDIFAQALPYLEEAVIIEPENLAVLRVLSTVFAKMGQYDKVKEIKVRILEAEAKEESMIK
ncbi:MAG: tetratricopeptide repeat protein [Bacteroidales bacterium]|nr:tetratricopeptide repeat protein [Bacteroidales bacterium]